MLLKFFKIAILFAIILFSPRIEASIVNASLVGEYISMKPHYSYRTRVIFKLNIEDGWHIYWANPGDAGEETVITLNNFKNNVIKSTSFSLPSKVKVEDFTEFGLKNKAYMMVELDIPAPNRIKKLSLDFDVHWLACKDTCVPGKTKVEFDLAISGNSNLKNKMFDEYLEYFPKPSELKGKYHVDDNVTLFIPNFDNDGKEINSLEIFPYNEKSAINYTVTPEFEISDKGLTIEVNKSTFEERKSLKALIKINGHIGYDVLFKYSKEPLDKMSFPLKKLLITSLMAFLGGIILNLMPCVLPILSLKAFQIINNKDKNKYENIKNALSYTCGILFAFIGLGLILNFLNYKETTVGWGFQMQHPMFVLAMIYVFWIIGLMLSDIIKLNFGFVNYSSKSAFLSGILTVLIASPCTAPFMGATIAWALMTKSQIMIISVFSCLGLGLAFPWLLIALFPSIGKSLPKPGQWMVDLKHFFAFFMYGTVIWLLWVLNSEIDTSNVIFIVLLSMLLIVIVSWIFKFKSKILKSLMAIICVIFIAFCFNLLSPLEIETKLSHEKFSVEKLNFNKSQKIPTFIKFSAKWCLTCIVNDNLVFKHDDINDAFRKNNVIVLHVDWTNRDAEIAKLIKNYGSSGVPLYVYFDGENEIILPPLITKNHIFELFENK